MSLYNGPPRGGARGGKDQFNWESVKSDKDREFYLGHSVKASVGRWQKGKDLFWYSREKKDDAAAAAAIQSELATIKAREEELMMEALGLKPKTVKPKSQPQLDKLDMKKLLEKGEDEEEDTRTDADQIKGIGYHGGQITGAGDAERETMAGVGLNRPARGVTGHPMTGQQLPPPPRLSEKDMKKMRKAQKKELKKAKRKAQKKELKKAKRKAKKAKKEAKREAKISKSGSEKRRSRHDSSSSSESDSSGSPSPPQKQARIAHVPVSDVHEDRINRQEDTQGGFLTADARGNGDGGRSVGRQRYEASQSNRSGGRGPTDDRRQEDRRSLSRRHHEDAFDRERRARRDSRSPERSRRGEKSADRHHRRRHSL